MRQLAAIAVAALFVLPLWFMASGSLREPGTAPPRTPELLPSPATSDSYDRAFALVDLARHTVNSTLVAAVTVPLAVLFGSWAAFAIFLLGRRSQTILIALSFAALMVPVTALLVPRFALFRTLGLIDTYVPLVASALLATSPLYVLVFYVAFRRLPAELYEACRLEGMLPFAIWRRIAMPLVRPVTVAVGVLAFVVSWGSFLEPLVYLYDEDLFTLPLGLRSLAQLDRTSFPLFLAGAVTATAPVLVVFLAAQRFFLHEPHRGHAWLGR